MFSLCSLFQKNPTMMALKHWKVIWSHGDVSTIQPLTDPHNSLHRLEMTYQVIKEFQSRQQLS